MDRKDRPLGLIIVLGLEIIVALRILLFVIPVVLNNYVHQHVPVAELNLSDKFMYLIAFLSVCYLMVGAVTLIGYSWGRFLHYILVGITAFLTALLIVTTTRAGQPTPGYYYFPLAFSVVTGAYLASLKGKGF